MIHASAPERWSDGPAFEVQTARVYRVLGRRFLTKRGALAFYARTRYRQLALARCGHSARRWQSCDCHDPTTEEAHVRRYVRLLLRWTAAAHRRPAREPRVQRGIRLRDTTGEHTPCATPSAS